MVADVVRFALAGLGLVLAVVCMASAVLAPTWDQRSRFLVVVGYSTIIVGGQLDTLGREPTWRTWALAVITVLALISTAAFLIRHVRQTRGGPGDGRSSRNQRRVLRARPPAGRASHAGDGARPQDGGPAP